ncbi:hypothetical protein RF11_00672 [Thelohanellus kitauei]|uniref:FLYWCH-type domain-containing protein n=1 Tax=Thelohanellus kitauei TaxID=669202 RepID=A0A0C2J5B3_THEKT|nr:hypothetical protein RF11_00672 [Thelohanellus kitauei]
MLCYEGYIYHKNRTKGQKIYWKCTKYRSEKCPRRLITHNGMLLSREAKHDHAPDIIERNIRLLVNSIKENALQTMLPTQNVISDSVQGLESAISASMPSLPALKKRVQRVRNELGSSIPLPSSTLDLMIPEDYKITLTGNRFLLYDNNSVERILIFSTEENLRLLSNHRTWFCDGTFKTCPSLFQQLYSIHVKIYESTVPLVYALLPRKNEATYNELFHFISRHITSQPISISVDFEKSSINSLSNYFPASNIKACYFHLGQSFWRKIQEHAQIRNLYVTNPSFCHKIKMLLSLAFLPISDVIRGFELMLEHEFFVSNENILQPLIEYFEDTYIGRVIVGNRRRTPIFPISLWNVHDATFSGCDRTTNGVEGWHHSFSRFVSGNHMPILKFFYEIERI